MPPPLVPSKAPSPISKRVREGPHSLAPREDNAKVGDTVDEVVRIEHGVPDHLDPLA